VFPRHAVKLYESRREPVELPQRLKLRQEKGVLLNHLSTKNITMAAPVAATQ
jgi:hypothetical protein